MAKNSKEYATYSDQLKSPKWQKKRLEILNLHKFTCDECNNDDELQLHVHHRFYLKNRLAWEYDNDVFQVLCEKCHGKIHDKTEKVKTVEVIPEKYKELIECLNDCTQQEIESIKYLIKHISKTFLIYDDFWNNLSYCFNANLGEFIDTLLKERIIIESVNMQIDILNSRHEKLLEHLKITHEDLYGKNSPY